MGRLEEELAWLKDHEWFDERPATLAEFLGDEYLGIEYGVRPAVKKVLVDIMGETVNGYKTTQFPRAMFTGAIGIGKTTIASVVLTYLVHWTLCLRDPQRFYDLLPGSRIAFMQMSTSESQAKEVIFGDIKARINHSPWFQGKYPFDKSLKNQLRFPKDIWILPGDSAETTFEGYNILGGILDEADSHKITKVKDYADAGYDTIHARVTSRFQDRGFVMIIGQMKSNLGFVSRKLEDFEADPDAYVARMTIWDSLGWDKFLKADGTRDSFYYDTARKEVLPKVVGLTGAPHLIEVPKAYLRDFRNDPEKALRDLAGIPPNVGDAFISLEYKVEACRDRYVQRYGHDSPVGPDGKLADWFMATDTLKRVCHVDIGMGTVAGDALGLAMGHVACVANQEGELKPYVIIDLLLRWTAPVGTEIFLSEVRQFIYELRDHRNFNIVKVTLDGFESKEMTQQLYRKRFQVEQVSMDKSLLPYYDLREMIYEDRLEFPKYLCKFRKGDTELTEIVIRELLGLQDLGNKIDHPPSAMGSKDVSDACAGVATTLAGDRKYRRKVQSLDAVREQKEAVGYGVPGFNHPALRGLGGITAPLPPSSWEYPNRR